MLETKPLDFPVSKNPDTCLQYFLERSRTCQQSNKRSKGRVKTESETLKPALHALKNQLSCSLCFVRTIIQHNTIVPQVFFSLQDHCLNPLMEVVEHTLSDPKDLNLILTLPPPPVHHQCQQLQKKINNNINSLYLL